MSDTTVRRETLDVIDGRYAVERAIGQGGMGRVVAARDLRLGRLVAIKLLPPGQHDADQLRRFEQEARAAGSLNHPNVLVVHDIGRFEGGPYIVSELLEGATLRDRLHDRPLPRSIALDYALQLAQGLRAAHEKGIVHRDLKPENLFVTSEGRLKILDFGIAKLAPAARVGESTQDGVILGTVPYMSPEQVRGEPADRRSDIFACGSILYEMLAGVRAFDGTSDLAVGSAILSTEPPALPAAPSIDRIVRRCLEKDPADRFQSGAELAIALATMPHVDRPVPRRAIAVALILAAAASAWLVARRATAPARGSIAVLPFTNLSSTRDDDYFSDGISEELINALTNVEGLRVAARTSAFAFRGRDVDVKEIGGQLQVSTVLEGSVRREGNKLRVAVQLVDARDGVNLWSNSYDRELNNVFSLENELSRAIVQALAPKLVGAAPLVRQSTASTEAHDLYLRGRYFWNKRTPEAIASAAESFQRAIDLDPEYALAYVGLADAYGVPVYWSVPPRELLARARPAVLKALELDPSLAEAHATLGALDQHQFDWADAEREFKRAIELKPGYGQAHHWYGLFLASLGRTTEARTELQLARELDPKSLVVNVTLALLPYYGRDYQRSIEAFTRTLELEAHATVLWRLSILYAQIGRYPEALAALDRVPQPIGRGLAVRAYVEAKSGDRAKALEHLAQLERLAGRQYVPPADIAAIEMALGDADRAFGLLDQGYAGLDWHLRELKVEPMWDPLRPDPRFAALLKRLKLE